jgi:hypothetical protein
MLRCWHLIWILVRTDHPCLGVGCDTVLVTWMSFASGVRKLRRCALSILKTHIVMSSLIFRLVLTLVLHLTLLHMLFLSSLMNLTITHMVLVHEITALCLNALVTTHVFPIVVTIFRIGLVFLL